MTKRRRLVCEILDNATYLLVFYGLFVTVLFAYSGDILDLQRAGLLAVPFVVNFFLRRISRIVVVSLIIHLLVPVIFLAAMPFEMYTLIWAVGLFVMAIFSTTYPFNKAPSSAAAFVATSTILFIVLSVWAGNRGYWGLASVYPPVLVGIVLGRHFLMRMLQMNKSLEAIQSTSQTPVKKILVFDYKVAMGLIVLMIGMIAVFYVFLVGPALRLAAELAPGLPQFPTFEADAEPERVHALPPGGMNFDDYMSIADTSNIFARLLGMLLRIIFSILAIVAVGALIALIIQAIIKFVGLRSSRVKQMRDVDGLEDEKEFVFPVEKWRKQRSKIFAKNEHPVRKLFRETAMLHIKNGVPIVKADTPAEIANRIKSENIAGLVEEYSLIRYGE